MTTPLYPTFEKRIDDAIDQLLHKQVEPWAFFNSGHPVQVKTFDGRNISYQGGGFEGSPRQVFWSRYMEPFLENLATQEIAAAVTFARERKVDARFLLPELQGLLLSASRKVFGRMAQTNQRLLGKGYLLFPDDVLRGSYVLSEKLSWHENGRKQRRHTLREAVVQIVFCYMNGALSTKGSNPVFGNGRADKQRAFGERPWRRAARRAR